MLIRPLKDPPHLAQLVQDARAAFDALTPEQKRAHRDAQRKSWVVGELMLEHPDLTRGEAVARYERVMRGEL
jgi:hypothetical protein